MSDGSFVVLKDPGFCESWFYGSGTPEYSNAISGALICLVVLWYTRRSARQPATDLVFAFLFANGVAACVFHYTLWELPGALDTFTMQQTVFILLYLIGNVNDVLRDTAGHSFRPSNWSEGLWMLTVTTVWSLGAVLTPWPDTGINFAWFFGGLAAWVIALLVYQTRLQPFPAFTIRFRWILLEFFLGAVAWESTEPWCATVPGLRNLFFFHTIWHLCVADATCRLLLLQQDRCQLKAFSLPV